MSMLSYLRMVLWSFLGIRRRANADAELARVTPRMLIAVALCAAALFAVIVWACAQAAVQALQP